jgi:hypothetical protein
MLYIGLILLSIFIVVAIYPKIIFKVLDLFEKKKPYVAKNYNTSRVWECKIIINKMWADKQTYFTNKGLDEYNARMQDLDKSIGDVRTEHVSYKKQCDIAIKEEVPFDLLGLHSMNKNGIIKVRSQISDLEVGLAESYVKIIELGFLYDLLNHTNELVKKDEFIEKAKKALDSDISFLEVNGKTNLTEGDSICIAFIESLLKVCKSPDFETYRERYLTYDK